MRIAIDARLYGLEHRGLGRYLKELVPRLVKAAPAMDFVLILDPRNRDKPEGLPPNVSVVNVPIHVYTVAEQWRLPGMLLRAGVSLTHFPHFAVPLASPRPFVLTLHDLILHQFPSSRATTQPLPIYRLKLAGYRLVLSIALRRAQMVMVPSQSVADDVSRFYPWAARKLVVIPLAPGAPTKAASIRLPQGPYVLIVGAAYPHKNLERAIEAVELARREVRDLRLVIVGRRDVFMDRLGRYVQQRGLQQVVQFWGEASEGELAALYQGAACYLQPSLAEGFGFGPLEALQYGCRVVAADIPVLREVLHHSAIFADPYQPDHMSDAILKSLRTTVEQPVAAVLQRYSWERVAEQTLSVYRQSISRR